MKNYVCALLIIWLLTLSACTYGDTSTIEPSLYIEKVTAQPTYTKRVETPTVMPSPTLEPEEAQTLISSLMTNNANCEGACFWGFVPGQSRINDILIFLEFLGRNTITGYQDANYYTSSIMYKDTVISLLFWERDKLVDSINITLSSKNSQTPIVLNDLGFFNPKNIVGKYGNPSKVEMFIGTSTEMPLSDTIAYGYILHYKDFIIQYYGQRVLAEQNLIRICPMLDNGLEDVQMWYGEKLKSPPVGGVSLDMSTSSKIESFYAVMQSSNEDACFDIDLAAFPP